MLLQRRLPLWFMAMAVNRVAAKYANVWARWHWGRRKEDERPLPDILLHRLPVLPYWVPELFMLAAVARAFTDRDRLAQFLAVTTPAMLFRALVICTTFYPTPLLCPPHWGYGANDLMFSGHTVMLFAAARARWEYVVAALGALSIIAARHHYTSDVVVAVGLVELLKRVVK
jgi:hypothetical protein